MDLHAGVVWHLLLVLLSLQVSGQIVVELAIASKGTEKFAFVWTFVSRGSTRIGRTPLGLPHTDILGVTETLLR